MEKVQPILEGESALAEKIEQLEEEMLWEWEPDGPPC